MASTPAEVLNKSLALSAQEIQALTGWPDEMVEDYLSLLNSLVILATKLDAKNDILKLINVITTSPYEIPEVAEDIFFDTTTGDIIANLRPGTKGRNYRLINVGVGGNKVIVNPYGTELLFGVNGPEYIYEEEALLITYTDIYGWH